MPHLSKSSPSAGDKGSNHDSVGHSLDSDRGYNVSSCLSAFSMMECAPNFASEQDTLSVVSGIGHSLRSAANATPKDTFVLKLLTSLGRNPPIPYLGVSVISEMGPRASLLNSVTSINSDFYSPPCLVTSHLLLILTREQIHLWSLLLKTQLPGFTGL